ncbi:hypothetical protein VOLCADRAFT_96850 [Volvox carteri f. nagariensis]|uniref:Uncharacterized protein n=1 Tax=Volvox carteri f. nagariensis TaxID=3068 RepID=D8UB82_VOLCA|nr:uncharacterized protein VOLCADRAFT_96850 [Volvox carteri f. nagariensis]EFJ43065.1 hypothetical protein VOLCADRAFT_96850 [Volvox carteri f. nagariensis]|eukprot:XP_002955864.1 hypothetical protein VOLCADRAFT_96850 [Volvox carteri f. nagariensis]
MDAEDHNHSSDSDAVLGQEWTHMTMPHNAMVCPQVQVQPGSAANDEVERVKQRHDLCHRCNQQKPLFPCLALHGGKKNQCQTRHCMQCLQALAHQLHLASWLELVWCCPVCRTCCSCTDCLQTVPLFGPGPQMHEQVMHAGARRALAFLGPIVEAEVAAQDEQVRCMTRYEHARVEDAAQHVGMDPETRPTCNLCCAAIYNLHQGCSNKVYHWPYSEDACGYNLCAVCIAKMPAALPRCPRAKCHPSCCTQCTYGLGCTMVLHGCIMMRVSSTLKRSGVTTLLASASTCSSKMRSKFHTAGGGTETSYMQNRAEAAGRAARGTIDALYKTGVQQTGVVLLILGALLVLVLVIMYIMSKIKQTQLQKVELQSGTLIQLDNGTQVPYCVDTSKMALVNAGHEFSYSTWLYLGPVYQPTANHKLILQRSTLAVTAQDSMDNNSNPVLFMDKNTNRLYVARATNRVKAAVVSLDDILQKDAARKYASGFLVTYIDYVPLQRWVNITVTVRDNTAYVFLDGDLYSAVSVTDVSMDGGAARPIIRGTASDLTIGHRIINTAGYVAGSSAWNYTLTQAKVQGVYKNGPYKKSYLSMFGLGSYGLGSPIYSLDKA